MQNKENINDSFTFIQNRIYNFFIADFFSFIGNSKNVKYSTYSSTFEEGRYVDDFIVSSDEDKLHLWVQVDKSSEDFPKLNVILCHNDNEEKIQYSSKIDNSAISNAIDIFKGIFNREKEKLEKNN